MDRADLLATYGPLCESAFEDFVVCLSNLTCVELMGMNPVCEPEIMAFEAVCV